MRRGAVLGVLVGALAVVAVVAAVAAATVRARAVRVGVVADRPAAVDAVAPLAVVLDARKDSSELVVVDLARRRVARRVALRSFVSDIALDAGSGTVVAAQSGGIADKADDAASLTDPRTGAVRYVTLAFPNPGYVACIAGKAYVQHGLLRARGLGVSVADVATARLAGSGDAPDGPGLWAAEDGSIWTSVADSDGVWSLARLDPSTLATSLVDVGGFRTLGITSAAGRVVLAGAATDGAGGAARVARMSASGDAVDASASVSGLRHPASAVAAVGDYLVVGDWNGEPPETGALAVLDARTLRQERTITRLGVPCALAAWQGRLVAVDRVGGRLLVVDPATGHVGAVIDLGTRDMVFSDVVVIEAGKE